MRRRCSSTQRPGEQLTGHSLTGQAVSRSAAWRGCSTRKALQIALPLLFLYFSFYYSYYYLSYCSDGPRRRIHPVSESGQFVLDAYCLCFLTAVCVCVSSSTSLCVHPCETSATGGLFLSPRGALPVPPGLFLCKSALQLWCGCVFTQDTAWFMFFPAASEASKSTERDLYPVQK